MGEFWIRFFRFLFWYKSVPHLLGEVYEIVFILSIIFLVVRGCIFLIFWEKSFSIKAPYFQRRRIMKKLMVFLCLIVLLCSGHLAFAACCAWDDRDACASCPAGYFSGCVTKSTKCDCSCAESSQEATSNMSGGDCQFQRYIQQNFDTIIKDTQYKRFHKYKGIKISITPPWKVKRWLRKKRKLRGFLTGL